MARLTASATVLLAASAAPAAGQQAVGPVVKVPPTGVQVCLALNMKQQDEATGRKGWPTPQACLDAGPLPMIPKQDGMRPANWPAYERVADHPLTSCVRDRASGLVWEGKVDSGKLAWMGRTVSPTGAGTLIETYGPHHEAEPGSRASTDAYSYWGDGRRGDAMAYVAQVNATQLCGYTDWRLPTVAELHGLVLLDKAPVAWWSSPPLIQPAVDARWLPNTVPGSYLTSEPHDERRIWCVSFSSGYVFACNRIMEERKSQPLFVRLVRGPEAPEAGRWREAPDEHGVAGGAVEDRHTGLVWRRCEEPQIWDGRRCTRVAQAYDYIEALQHASQQAGWRLPSVKEVNSPVERCYQKLDIPASDFPKPGLERQPLRAGYWTSTVCAAKPETSSARALIRGWALGNGGNVYCEARTERHGLRLVRE